MSQRTWHDRIWIVVAALIAAAYGVSFAAGQFRSSSTHQQTTQTQQTVKTETAYLGDLARFANFIATDLNTLCHTVKIYLPATICAVAPSFSDPPGLPTIGVTRGHR